MRENGSWGEEKEKEYVVITVSVSYFLSEKGKPHEPLKPHVAVKKLIC